MKYFYIIITFIILLIEIDLWILHVTCNQLKEITTKHTDNIINIKTEFNYLNTFNKKLQKRLLKLEQKVNNSTLVKVKVTYYCPWVRGTNSDSNPNRTALMTKPKPGYTIAISKALVDKGWLGHKVYVEGFGIGRIEDRMGKSIKGDCIDICVGTKEEAIKKGKRTNINMIKLKDSYG